MELTVPVAMISERAVSSDMDSAPEVNELARRFPVHKSVRMKRAVWYSDFWRGKDFHLKVGKI
jgi:hypothetical protein